MNTFLILLAFLLGSMSAVFQNSCLLWLDLAILWPKVVKNYGVPEIRVFLGLIFGISLAQSAEEHGVSKIRVFLGLNFGISLAKVLKNHGVPEILWRFSGIQKCSKFVSFSRNHVVGELSCQGCELEIEC